MAVSEVSKPAKEGIVPLKLAEEINLATKDVHMELNKLIMSRLPLGLKNPAALGEGLRSYYHVYQAFESVLLELTEPSVPQSRTKTMLQHVLNDQILRAPQFEKDLLYYNKLDTLPPAFLVPSTPARQSVSNRIRENLLEKPHLLLAYAHCMYMALFAGGFHIKTAMLRSRLLFKGEDVKENAECNGTSIFSFKGCETREDELRLREKFRAGMIEAERILLPEERTEIVKESRQIFLQNEQLLYELDEICASIPQSPPQKTGPLSRSMPARLKDSFAGGVLLIGAFFGYIIYMAFLKPSHITSLPVV